MAVSKALERQVDPGMAFWGSLGRQVGPEPAVWRTLGRQVGPETVVWEPGNVLGTLKRRFGCFFSVIFGKRAFCENRRFT